MLTGKAGWKEIMASPISRAEAMQMEERLTMNAASCAAGLEALEGILVKQGILKENELMAAVKSLIEQKGDQAHAAAVTSPIIQGV